MSTDIREPKLPADRRRDDEREGLYNECPRGRAAEIQVPAERITRLLGIMLDLDPGLLLPGNPLFPPADDPRAFLEGIRPVLDRHPLARHAEVRASGTGLHLILRLDPPVELHSAAEQRRWGLIVRAVQCSLPSDPHAPGITALTRAVGSVNSKNGATVEVLEPGEPIDPGAVASFVERLFEAPFRAVATVLLGDVRVLPCPVCRGERSRLDVLDRSEKCYSCCGTVTLDGLYDCVFRPSRTAVERGQGEKFASAPPPRRGRANPRARQEVPPRAANDPDPSAACCPVPRRTIIARQPDHGKTELPRPGPGPDA